MASQIANAIITKKWSELTDAEKASMGDYTRSDHMAARDEYKAGLQGSGEFTGLERSINLPDGQTYDTTSVGKKHFGKDDYQELLSQGYDRDEINQAIYEEGNYDNLGARFQLQSPEFKGHTGDINKYDPASVGTKRISKSDIAGLLGTQGGGQAYTPQEINEAIKANNWKVGTGAQEMLNKRLESMTGNPPTDVTANPGDKFIDTRPITDVKPVTPKPDVTAPGAPSDDEDITPDYNIGNGVQSQQVDINKMNNNTFNVDQKDATIFGNNNIGSDFSTTIISQGSGPSTGLNNLESTAASTALLENIFNNSQNSLNGYSRAAGASAAANAVTGADERIAGLDYLTRLDPYKMGAKADEQALNTFGDIYNPQFSAGMNFQMPDPPKPPEGVDEDLLDKFKL